MKQFDVIIVGNGILGLTLAYFLKKENPKLSVALIGKKERQGCATLVAAAMLNLWAEVVHGQFEDESLAQRFDLTRQGVAAWPQFAEELSEISGEKINIKWGTYVLKTLKSTQIEDRNFLYLKQVLKRFEIEHKELLEEDLPWLKPSQCSRTIEALWVPDGSVDSRVVVRALDKALRQQGVHFFDQNAVQIKPEENAGFTGAFHTAVLEDQAQISAKHLVLANGAYAQALIDPCHSLRNSMPRLLFGAGASVDITFPNWIFKYGGLGTEILDLQEVIRTTDRGGACGVHLIHYGNGKFYAGASSQIALEPDNEPKLHGVHALLHSLTYEFHRSFFHTGISLRGNGFRPTSADCFPMIGETSIKGLWLLNGTKRDGFSMSPHISKELAQAILEKPHTLPEKFYPCRPLISYKTKDEAIKDSELMFIGADYQHGGIQVPYMVDSYRAMRKKGMEDAYKKRSLHNFGIYPELIHLYENDDFYKQIDHKKAFPAGNNSGFLKSFLKLFKSETAETCK